MGGDFMQYIDPLAFRVGPLFVRYYTLFFLATCVIGYFLWRWQIVRAGRSSREARGFILFGLMGLVVFARLYHCLLYEPAHFLSHPLEILLFWRGGIASHGAALGLVAALVLYARLRSWPWLDTLDRFTFSAAVGAALVRLGNFFNSEIVGRETSVPWAVRFMRYDGGAVARHPSQIYEFAIGAAMLAALFVCDGKAGREARPKGLLSGVFLSGYFFLRFFVEFFKEPQEVPPLPLLTMGQWSSLPFFAVGLVLIAIAVRRAGATGR
jgi:phosphatidylglycerol---prolipoprotein diacylglyceryl transferase